MLNLNWQAAFVKISGTGILPSLHRFVVFVLCEVREEITTDGFYLTLRRVCIACFAAALIFSLIIWNHLGFFLDDLLFPRWKDQKIVQPIFIVGNARSGTTWMHRLFTMNESSDTYCFSGMRTWEMMFAASVTWRLLFFILYNIDRKVFFGLGLKALVPLFSLMGDFKVKSFTLLDAEEDDWLMMHIFLCHLILLVFPLFAVVMNPWNIFDIAEEENLPAHIKESIMKYYKECVQRHLFARFGLWSEYFPKHYADKKIIYTSKNPTFTYRLKVLYKTFPDCKVISLVRDPVESVPSLASFLSEIWHGFCVPKRKYLPPEANIDLAKRAYFYPPHFFHSNNIPRNQWALVSYSSLKEDLLATALGLLARLEYRIPDVIMLEEHVRSQITTATAAGLTVTDDYVIDLSAFEGCELTAMLRAEQGKVARFKSGHQHSLAMCLDGMTEVEFREIFKAVYDSFPEFAGERPNRRTVGALSGKGKSEAFNYGKLHDGKDQVLLQF